MVLTCSGSILEEEKLAKDDFFGEFTSGRLKTK